MNQNDANFTVDSVIGFITKTTFCINGSTENKYFFRKKSLKKYLEKIFQEGSVESQIDQTLSKFKEKLKPGKYIRLNEKIDYPKLVTDLIETEEKFFGKDKDRDLAIQEYVDRCISKINEQSKKLQIETYKEFFDTVENNPLTDAQREACVSDQCNNLVLAGAGSGKP